MSTLFTINFRREAYQREVARTRRRVVALGVWVAYFGVLGVITGLYGLNCAALSSRVRQIERQTTRLSGRNGGEAGWTASEAQIATVEHYIESPRQWHARLARLAALLPANARLASIAVNPQNLTDPASQSKLVIAGTFKAAPGQDRMQGVIKIVATLHDDPVFGSSYHNIKLASTHGSEEQGGAAEFVIECRE